MCVFFFKHKTAYELRISDWSSDVCSSDLARVSGGYGTPQIGNLFVAADGNPGNNTELDSQRHYGVDVGAAWQLAQSLRVDVTGFYELFRDELVSQYAGIDKHSYTVHAPLSEHHAVEARPGWQPLTPPLPGEQLSMLAEEPR